MKTATGVCKFCGQQAALEVPEEFTQEMIDEEAVKNCDCPEAEAYTAQQERIANGEGAVKTCFEDSEDMDALRDELLRLVAPVIDGTFGKITIERHGFTGSMKPSKDGVKVSLSHKIVKSAES